MKDTILGFVRHLLTFGGGFLTSAGIATASEIETGVAAIATLVGLVWSILDKRNRQQPAQ